MENQTRQRPTRLGNAAIGLVGLGNDFELTELHCEDTCEVAGFQRRTSGSRPNWLNTCEVAGFQRRTFESRPNWLRHARPAGEWPNYRDLLENLTAVSVGSGIVARRDCNGAMMVGNEH
ncbi:hypothetical protein NL676_007163 [Syzygium grande]|nr:hypothetical protein NL676_007163 [Syzygium grande]